jgi:hypothetical protein
MVQTFAHEHLGETLPASIVWSLAILQRLALYVQYLGIKLKPTVWKLDAGRRNNSEVGNMVSNNQHRDIQLLRLSSRKHRHLFSQDQHSQPEVNLHWEMLRPRSSNYCQMMMKQSG